MKYEVSQNANDRYYVVGIGSHHSDVLAPHLSFATIDEARIAAKHAEEAYKHGYTKAQQAMRASIGIYQ